MPASALNRLARRASPLALVCALLALCAATALPAADELKVKDIKASAPIKNFRLPTFTDDGWRDMMLRAAEARVLSAERIEVSDMKLVLYTHDAINQPETTVTSPLAVALPAAQRVEGADTVHVLRNDLELTGRDWSYDHVAKKITIGQDAHVILQTEIKDLLK